MRLGSIGLFLRAFGIAQLEGSPVVDRGHPATQLDLALQIEFLCRFISGVDPPYRLQSLKCRFVFFQPVRLTFLAIGLQPKPGQVGADRLDIFFFGSFRIGIVDTQQKLPATLLGQHPIVQGGADIADVEVARRRGRKACFDHAICGSHRGFAKQA